MKSSLFIFLLCTLSWPALSEGWATVKFVDVGIAKNSQYAYANLEAPETISTCQVHTQLRWELIIESDKALLSIALSSLMADKSVSIHVKDNDCLGDSPRVNVMAVKK